MMLVVDASVAVKVVIEEPGSSEAALLLAGADEVIAPTIVRMEVASALAKKVRYHGLPLDVARASLAGLRAFIPRYVPADDLGTSAFALSVELNHALQDCIYLALAVERDGVLTSADQKFVAAIGRGGLGRYVSHFTAMA